MVDFTLQNAYTRNKMTILLLKIFHKNVLQLSHLAVFRIQNSQITITVRNKTPQFANVDNKSFNLRRVGIGGESLRKSHKGKFFFFSFEGIGNDSRKM